jgi:hypothetical protein
MIHLEPAFTVNNEATSELVRISDRAVRGSGMWMWIPTVTHRNQAVKIARIDRREERVW